MAKNAVIVDIILEIKASNSCMNTRVCDAHSSNMVNRWGYPVTSEIRTIVQDNISQVIIKESKSYDLTVLRSVRRQTAGGGIAVSNLTTELLKRLTGSLVLFSEPENNT